MTSNNAPSPLGVLEMLPIELRTHIYHFHLISNISFLLLPEGGPSGLRTHLDHCPNPPDDHAVNARDRTISCITQASYRRTTIKNPFSRLSLVAASKMIYQEAVPIFYKYNCIIFSNVSLLDQFILDCPNRVCYLGKFCFQFLKFHAGCEGLFAQCLRTCEKWATLRVGFGGLCTI